MVMESAANPIHFFHSALRHAVPLLLEMMIDVLKNDDGVVDEDTNDRDIPRSVIIFREKSIAYMNPKW